MSARLVVVDPGARATLQDAGRTGLRRMGVPPGGAADAPLRRLAAALAGGPEDAASIEFVFRGPRLRAEGGPVRLSLVGASGKVEGEEARAAPALRTVTLAPGETLAVGAAERVFGYVGVEGGIDVSPVMGSRSTETRAGFGGFEGRPLAAGDALPVSAARDGPERAAAAPAMGEGPIRVILGPQRDHFTDAAAEAFLSAEWRVGSEVDRMGARLEGPRLEHSALGADIASEALGFGAIQVPAGGAPIILGSDAQTIGGYPKIAVVATADLPRVSRLRPGDPLRFAAVTLDEAAAAWRAAEADLSRALASIGPVAASGADPAALASENLVSGVVDALDPVAS